MQSTSNEYQTEEAKNVGAKPHVYVAFMRTIKEFEDVDFADDSTSECIHTNTEYIDSSDILQLQDADESSGEMTGNWVSEILDSGHLTPNVIFDKITWTETLNGGTITVQIRTANTSGGIAAASYVTYNNNTLDHTERYRYYQVKISLVEGTSSPELSALKIRHKALIPRTDYKSLGTINYGLDIDFFSCTAGSVSITVDNKAHQFTKYQPTSYIYNIRYYYQLLEIWAGFELPDTSIEWLQQFVGEIERIQTDSGLEARYNAVIMARDFIYRKLTNTVIGRPTSAGIPQPYMSGKRYRVLCKETDSDNYIYSFYCQQTITSIDAVYVRNTGNQKWITAPSNSTNAVTKTVDFVADPESEVAVDITVNSVDHPCDIIEDILINELGLDSEYYDSTSLETVKTRLSSLSVGVAFEKISIYQALQQLMRSIDGAMFIEGGVLKIVNYWPTLVSNQSFGVGVHNHVEMEDLVSEVQNKVSVFYGNYNDDNTQYIEILESTSIDNYGELTKESFDFRFQAQVSIASETYIGSIVGHWLYRQQYQYEKYVVTLFLEVLRQEIFDVITLTDTKHNLTDALMLTLSQDINLDKFSGSFTSIRYPEINWAFGSDTGDTEDLYYAVDDSATDIAYHCYAW